MKIVEGNLLDLAADGEFDVIVHGCNCFNTMGSGIAKQIKERFPLAYETDCKTTKGDESKLGTYSYRNEYPFGIINAYTQFDYGIGLRVDYEAIRSVFRTIKTDFQGFKIGYPAIGAGLAGGNWEIISKIIDEELVGEDHTFVRYIK